MKLTTMTQVSVDGVMQGCGGSDEDPSGGFERGGWAMGVFDPEAMTFINHVYQRADAFLFGRRPYEIFADYWGAEERARAAMEDPGIHPIAAALNTKRCGPFARRCGPSAVPILTNIPETTPTAP